MLTKIEHWIDNTLEDYSGRKVSCDVLASHFNGFYRSEFLEESSFVVVDEIPKPDFLELRQAGLGDFIDMDAAGITYKDTYFIKKGNENRLDLHFHELVHVIQWNHLGAASFIRRYMKEINEYGYENAPLEIMAYSLDAYFSDQKPAFDIQRYVFEHI